jgi:hypothetical protein
MYPKYKPIEILKEYCPVCDEQLQGNNSIAFPWKCKCGTWEAVKYPFTGEYEIIKQPLQK